MKIGYFADGPWAHEAFKKIIRDNELKIVFICVRNDKKDPVLIDYGKKYNIPVLWNSNINSDEFLELLKTFEADIFVSMSFNQIFKERIIEFPREKTINCHAGKLPFYRGRNVLNWALINDEKEFGITVHYVDSGIDTGDIILQKTFPINESDDYSTLLSKAYIGCADILYEAIKIIQMGHVKRIPQNTIDPVGFYCGMRTRGDEILDWNQNSRDIYNFVRAICKPGPQSICYLNNEEIKINKVNLIKNIRTYKGIPGQVIGKTEYGYYVKTNDTMIEIIEYTGPKLKIGDRLKSGKEKLK